MAKKKTKRARKKKDPRLQLTNKIIKEASALALKGNFRQDIAKRLKINLLTWNSWLDRGRKRLRELEEGTRSDRILQCKLVEELNAAEAEARAKLMEDVSECDDPRTKLQFLKLRHGKYFAQNQNTNDDTGEIAKRSNADLLAEKLAAFLED